MTVSHTTTILKRAKLFRMMMSNRRKSFTLNQLTILFTLEDIRQQKHEPLSVTEMASAIDVAVATASAVLKRLEEQKLLVRKIAKTGQRGRQRTISLITRQGTKIIDSFMK